MKRILTDPAICHGKARIEGTRLPVHIILDLLAAGESHKNILAAYPQIIEQDILSCINYAAKIVTEEIISTSEAA